MIGVEESVLFNLCVFVIGMLVFILPVKLIVAFISMAIMGSIYRHRNGKNNDLYQAHKELVDKRFFQYYEVVPDKGDAEVLKDVEADVAESEGDEPEGDEPEGDESEGAESEVAESEGAESEVAESEVAESEVADTRK